MNPWKPSGVRVWWGYRHEQFAQNRAGFDKTLSSIFIPQTWQQMSALGLCAYFPALVPLAAEDEWPLPDELALVHYPSAEQYRFATRETVAGRAYGLLHSTAFNFNNPLLPTSGSDFPAPWVETVDFAQPTYLVDKAIQWRSGVTHMLMARPILDVGSAEYKKQINQAIQQWLKQRESHVKGSDSNVDGAIILMHPHWLCYWEHRTDSCEQNSLLPLLRPLLQDPIIDKQASTITVPPLFSGPDDGVDIKQGDFVDVGFT